MTLKKFLWTAVMIPPTAVAGYMACVLWRDNDDGRWLFAVFALFFLVLAVAPFLPKSRQQKEEEKVPTTRFASSWVLPFYLILFLGSVAVAMLAHLAKP